MFDNNEYFEIMEESRQSYERLKENKENNNRDLLLEHRENWSKVDKGRNIFEEYDEELFEKKLKVDMLFFEQLLEKIDDENREDVEKLCGSLYRKIKNIYEFVNVQPELYGGLTFDLVEESIENKYREVSKVIYEYLDYNFYNLSSEKRTENYYDSSKDIAKKLIAEGNDVNESIEYGTKVSVMEGLIRRISFPFGVMSRINYLLEDSDYGAVFDQEALQDHVDSFYNSVRNLAKVIAACV